MQKQSKLEEFAARICAPPEAADRGQIAERLDVHFLDSIAAMVAGAISAEGRELAGDASCSMAFGGGALDDLILAVSRARLTEIDDIHMASCTTVGSVIVPVALCVAAVAGADGSKLEAGIRAGYDAMVRFATATGGARILYEGLWPTYLAAPVGAAACAAGVLGLDPARTADALALALARTSGAVGRPVHGRNARWLFAGWAAADGVRAALAARAGFGGDRSLLDGNWLKQTHGLAFDSDRLAGAPGSALLEMSIKPWCTAKQACAALAGFIKILDRGVQPADIEAVIISVPEAYQAMIAHQPPGRIGRIVSIAWQCALAAHHLDSLLDIDRVDHSQDAEFANFLKKVSVEPSPALAAHFPQHYPAQVNVRLNSGEILETLVMDAPGDPGCAFGRDAVAAKFLKVTASSGKGEALLRMAQSARDGANSIASLHRALQTIA